MNKDLHLSMIHMGFKMMLTWYRINAAFDAR